MKSLDQELFSNETFDRKVSFSSIQKKSKVIFIDLFHQELFINKTLDQELFFY